MGNAISIKSAPFIFQSSNNTKSITLPVGPYGGGINYLTLRDKHRLKVYENRILWTLYRLTCKEIT
jgi:hypothetical protein